MNHREPRPPMRPGYIYALIICATFIIIAVLDTVTQIATK